MPWQPLPSWWPEADKLTLGQELTVQVPCSVLTLMKYKGSYWLTNSQMVRYQSMLYAGIKRKIQQYVAYRRPISPTEISIGLG
jgi:hypothetical protein